MTDRKRDAAAPTALILDLKTTDGQVWGTVMATAKEFKTGSVGFYANDKLPNPKSGERYQIGINIILIGSKG